MACFQRSDKAGETLVLGACLLGHRLHRLELLALDDIHVGQDLLALGAHQAFGLLAQTLCRTRGIGHELRHLVEYAVRCLCHRCSFKLAAHDAAS